MTLEVEFGNGIHFCIGAALARAEAHIAINSLLARYPDLQLGSDGLEWKSIVVKNYPTLADANIDVSFEAMDMGYPQDRKFFRKQLAAKDLITPVLTKLYRDGDTPVSVVKELAQQVNNSQK